MIIETNRLILRELTQNDFDALYSVLADSDIMEHYPYTFDKQRVQNWINKNIERYNTFGFGLWAVVLKETNQMIGDCGITIQNINGQLKPEIGYHIRKDFQKMGFAKESASAVKDWAFSNTPFRNLYSYMKATNIGSYSTAKSIGMTKVSEYIDNENEKTFVCMISK